MQVQRKIESKTSSYHVVGNSLLKVSRQNINHHPLNTPVNWVWSGGAKAEDVWRIAKNLNTNMNKKENLIIVHMLQNSMPAMQTRALQALLEEIKAENNKVK